MKRKYIIATIILSLAVIIIGILNIRFTPTPRDRALTRTPKEAEVKYPPILEPNRGNELPQLTIIWEKNLFVQGRGTVEKNNDNSGKHSDLELVGICKFGDKAGAIIINKNTSAVASMQMSVPQVQPVAQTVKPQAPQPQNAKSPVGKTEKRFYLVGQRLPNGFTLKEIKQDSVILARGSEEAVLKMQVGSKEGAKRIASFKPVEHAPDVPANLQPQQEQVKPSPSIEKEAKGSDKKLPKPPPPPIMNQAESIKEV